MQIFQDWDLLHDSKSFPRTSTYGDPFPSNEDSIPLQPPSHKCKKASRQLQNRVNSQNYRNRQRLRLKKIEERIEELEKQNEMLKNSIKGGQSIGLICRKCQGQDGSDQCRVACDDGKGKPFEFDFQKFQSKSSKSGNKYLFFLGLIVLLIGFFNIAEKDDVSFSLPKSIMEDIQRDYEKNRNIQIHFSRYTPRPKRIRPPDFKKEEVYRLGKSGGLWFVGSDQKQVQEQQEQEKWKLSIDKLLVSIGGKMNENGFLNRNL